MLKSAFKHIKETKDSPAETSDGAPQASRINDTWCPQPWVGMSVRSVGDLRYCCHAHQSPGRGILTNDKGEPLSLENDSIAAGKNSQLLKDVRQAMLKGKRHPGCQRCYREEDAGIYSRRHAEQFLWPEQNFDLFNKHTSSDGTIDEEMFPVRYLDLRFGNRCNLKCRMCGSTESDRWYSLQKKVYGHSTFKEGDRKLEVHKDNNGQFYVEGDPYTWHESPRFWKELEKYLPKLQRIYLAGGEPLLIEKQFDLLRHCIEKGYSKNLILEYNTNITVITPKILEIWSHFRRIDIGMSIDGIGAFNDYIRSGSRWPQIAENIKNLDSAPGNYRIWWAATIQIYNLLHLPEMMKWIVQQKFERVNQSKLGREIMSPHPLSNPKQLSIQTFPRRSKDLIRARFEKQKKEFREHAFEWNLFSEQNETLTEQVIKRFDTILDNYTNVMFAKDSSHLNEKFWKYTRRLDQIHGTSFEELCPETAELMREI